MSLPEITRISWRTYVDVPARIVLYKLPGQILAGLTRHRGHLAVVLPVSRRRMPVEGRRRRVRYPCVRNDARGLSWEKHQNILSISSLKTRRTYRIAGPNRRGTTPGIGSSRSSSRSGRARPARPFRNSSSPRTWGPSRTLRTPRSARPNWTSATEIFLL